MRIQKILRNILIGIVIFVLAVLLILQIGVTVRYWDYFTNSKTEFRIPGLWDRFVPQGFDLMEDGETFLVCGYMSDDTPSRIYVRSTEGKTHYSQLYYADGTPYLQHAGGICHNGKFAYLPSDSGVDVFLLSDILEGKDAKVIGSIPTGHDMAFCSFYNGYLLAGNFYYPGHYETPDHHRITTPAGDANTALITVFKADDASELGVDPNAVAAISTTDRVQGMCITAEGEIVLSTSWSINDSKLLYYTLDTQRTGTVQTLTGEVPLYYLDSANLVRTVTAPPMSEELVYKDGRVWVMCESACSKYIYGRLIRGGRVYAYEAE